MGIKKQELSFSPEEQSVLDRFFEESVAHILSVAGREGRKVDWDSLDCEVKGDEVIYSFDFVGEEEDERVYADY